jgi:transposase InsO family protein
VAQASSASASCSGVAQPLISERPDSGRIRRAIPHGLQHAPRTGAEEIRYQARELEMRFFEQRFEPALELDAIARELIPATHHRPHGALGRLTPSEYAEQGQTQRSEAARLHATPV